MALDEPKDTDHVMDIDGFTYIIDKTFAEKAEPIRIDFTEMGFKLDCAINFTSACSSCGTKTSSCC